MVALKQLFYNNNITFALHLLYNNNIIKQKSKKSNFHKYQNKYRQIKQLSVSSSILLVILYFFAHL